MKTFTVMNISRGVSFSNNKWWHEIVMTLANRHDARLPPIELIVRQSTQSKFR
ncbi:hypothetical protein [Vibrio vulnificus]|uniref:hypothetical protein n=1 Tax=Vibrio vulnificus TaxID=672 RepID=UPI003ED97898